LRHPWAALDDGSGGQGGGSMIRKTAKGYVLRSKDGSRKLGGPYRTRAEALKRERQVQFFKHAKKRG
jgi:hypothetical protein